MEPHGEEPKSQEIKDSLSGENPAAKAAETRASERAQYLREQIEIAEGEYEDADANDTFGQTNARNRITELYDELDQLEAEFPVVKIVPESGAPTVSHDDETDFPSSEEIARERDGVASDEDIDAQIARELGYDDPHPDDTIND